MMRVLIVDDEPPARDELRVLLEAVEGITIAGEAGNAVEAIAAINRLRPEVVFLDIQMPRINGLEMLAMLDPEHAPRIVFITAHDDYAVQAFEENAFDYLLKPVDPIRLDKTLQRLQRDHAPQDIAPLKHAHPLRQVPCSGHNRISLLRVEDIEYVASRASGVYVVGADGQERFTELSLLTLEGPGALHRAVAADAGRAHPHVPLPPSVPGQSRPHQGDPARGRRARQDPYDGRPHDPGQPPLSRRAEGKARGGLRSRSGACRAFMVRDASQGRRSSP
jgi:two-component system, LytTR family, response regulator